MPFYERVLAPQLKATPRGVSKESLRATDPVIKALHMVLVGGVSIHVNWDIEMEGMSRPKSILLRSEIISRTALKPCSGFGTMIIKLHVFKSYVCPLDLRLCRKDRVRIIKAKIQNQDTVDLSTVPLRGSGPCQPEIWLQSLKILTPIWHFRWNLSAISHVAW